MVKILLFVSCLFILSNGQTPSFYWTMESNTPDTYTTSSATGDFTYINSAALSTDYARSGSQSIKFTSLYESGLYAPTAAPAGNFSFDSGTVEMYVYWGTGEWVNGAGFTKLKNSDYSNILNLVARSGEGDFRLFYGNDNSASTAIVTASGGVANQWNQVLFKWKVGSADTTVFLQVNGGTPAISTTALAPVTNDPWQINVGNDGASGMTYYIDDYKVWTGWVNPNPPEFSKATQSWYFSVGHDGAIPIGVTNTVDSLHIINKVNLDSIDINSTNDSLAYNFKSTSAAVQCSVSLWLDGSALDTTIITIEVNSNLPHSFAWDMETNTPTYYTYPTATGDVTYDVSAELSTTHYNSGSKSLRNPLAYSKAHYTPEGSDNNYSLQEGTLEIYLYWESGDWASGANFFMLKNLDYQNVINVDAMATEGYFKLYYRNDNGFVSGGDVEVGGGYADQWNRVVIKWDVSAVDSNIFIQVNDGTPDWALVDLTPVTHTAKQLDIGSDASTAMEFWLDDIRIWESWIDPEASSCVAPVAVRDSLKGKVATLYRDTALTSGGAFDSVTILQGTLPSGVEHNKITGVDSGTITAIYPRDSVQLKLWGCENDSAWTIYEFTWDTLVADSVTGRRTDNDTIYWGDTADLRGAFPVSRIDPTIDSFYVSGTSITPLSVSDSLVPFILPEQVDAGICTLVVADTVASDTVYFYCAGEYTPPPPTITAQPANTVDSIGGDTALYVTASGADSYQWQRKLRSGGDSTDISGEIYDSLHFTGLSFDDTLYYYRARAINEVGEDTSSWVSIEALWLEPVISGIVVKAPLRDSAKVPCARESDTVLFVGTLGDYADSAYVNSSGTVAVPILKTEHGALDTAYFVVPDIGVTGMWGFRTRLIFDHGGVRIVSDSPTADNKLYIKGF